MRRNELPTYLKKIHPGLRVKRYSNRGEHLYHGGNDAVYFYGTFVGAIPPGNIYISAHQDYKNIKGIAHRSLRGLIHRIKSKGVIYRSCDVRAVR